MNTHAKSDYRIQSYESLQLIAQPTERYQPLQLYCHHYMEYFTATSVDVSMYIHIAVKKVFTDLAVAEVSGQGSKFDAEYKEELELQRKRK
jgi:hypothetical protein